jgi:hypothetical protein
VMKKYLLIYKHAIVMHVSTIVKNTICRYHCPKPCSPQIKKSPNTLKIDGD